MFNSLKAARSLIPLCIFLILALVLYQGLKQDPSLLPSAMVGKPVPKFKLATVNDSNQFYTEEIFRGKISLLNVWATWCISCRMEHNFLNKLAADGSIQLIGLDYRDRLAAVEQWQHALGDPYKYDLFDEEGRVAIDLGVYGTPETFIIDPQGIIRYRHVGIIDQAAWENDLLPVIEKIRGRG